MFVHPLSNAAQTEFHAHTDRYVAAQSNLSWSFAAPSAACSNSHAPFLGRFIDPSMEFFNLAAAIPAASQINIIAELKTNDQD
jgi:hypothetical protein